MAGLCRSCGEPIIWCKTAEFGNRMPVDVEPTETGTIELSGSAPPIARVVSKTGRHPGQKLYVSHFSTCPHADLHRNRKVATRRVTPPAMPRDGLFSEVAR